MARKTLIAPWPGLASDASLREKGVAVAGWAQASRPARVVKHFTSSNGPVLAAGMAYSALFSAFAALWVLFSVVGLVFAANEPLRAALIGVIDGALPGVIGPDGIIEESDLVQAGILGWTGAIALVGLVWTALNWMQASRSSIRAMFSVPRSTGRSFAFTKLRDLVIMIAFAAALIVSAALTLFTTSMIDWLLSLIGLSVESPGAEFGLRAASTFLVFAFDTAILAVLLRILAELRIPPRQLIIGAAIGGAIVGVIKQLGSLLLGGAANNPLLASFAVILGVLIFLNLLCTVLLYTACWIAVTMDDIGEAARLLTASEADAEAAESEFLARRERLAADRIRLRDELNRAPRFRRWRPRRKLERVIAEQEQLHREDVERRTGVALPE